MSKTIAVEPAPAAPVETILPTNWTPAQVEAFRQSQHLRSTWTRGRLTREIEAIYRMDPAESERDWQMVSEWMRSQPSPIRPKPATKPAAPATSKKVKAKEPLPFYATAGYLFNASVNKRLARGTYATFASSSDANLVANVKIRVGTATKGTVFETSLTDILRVFFSQKGLKFDPVGVTLPPPPHKAASSAD
jgi:hypothetical protein